MEDAGWDVVNLFMQGFESFILPVERVRQVSSEGVWELMS